MIGHNNLEQEIFSPQVEPGSPLPSGHGGLRPGRHPHAPRPLHPQLQAREQVFARGNGLPPPRHGVHGEPPDDGAERRPRFT